MIHGFRLYNVTMHCQLITIQSTRMYVHYTVDENITALVVNIYRTLSFVSHAAFLCEQSHDLRTMRACNVSSSPYPPFLRGCGSKW